MQMTFFRICIIFFAIMVSGCVTTAPPSMSYESCATADVCTIRGTATAKMGEHAPIVELGLGNGRCINVSLPRPRWEQLKKSGPKEIVVTGNVYWEPPDDDGQEIVLQVNGRKIGLGRCGRFFVFVAD